MRFSLQVRYAVCGLFDLAYNGAGQPVQVRIIGERQGIPARYLEQIFQRLRKSGLVRGKRGPGGGYILARAPSEITLRHIVEGLEGPASEWFESGLGDVANAHRPDFVWAELAGSFRDLLDTSNLELLCRRAAQCGVPHADAANRMYFI